MKKIKNLLRDSLLFFIVTIFIFLPGGLNSATLGDSINKNKYSESDIVVDNERGKRAPIFKNYDKNANMKAIQITTLVKPAKDPRLACLLSLTVPGSGQIYLRKDIKGIAFCLAAGTGYTVTGYFVYRYFFGSGTSESTTKKLTVTGLLFLATLVVHVVSIVEAYSDGEDMQNKNVYKSGSIGNPYSGEITRD